MRNKKITIGILAAIAAFILTAVILKPSGDTLLSRISPDMKDGAGERYAETNYNFLVVHVVRGKNQKTAASETYIGFMGNIISVSNKEDNPILMPVSDVLLWLPTLVSGARITISLTVAAVCAGVFGSVFLALGKISKNKILNGVCGAYIFFFRGTPLLMQLFFIYYGLPQISPALTINNKFLAAFVAFALNSAAYCAEIIRAAIQSIDKGQFEASRALGLTYGQTMSLIIVPQSIRRLIPPVANEFIMVLKDASLVSIIALSDLTHTTRSISSSSGSVLVYIPAMVIYLIITGAFTFVFNKLEKKFSIYQ
ncbi:hypothetical protein FACS189490_07400 [Clostridia bacterium]|nr:hypothetical protein FACS189490_07400 [Clostridia bacterium]